MSRSAASLDGRYTEEEVLAVVHADVARLPDVRMEVYDRNLNLTTLQPVVKECTVDFDASRAIHSSMTLVMEPVEQMRNALFQYVLSPLVGIGPMADGGTAWHRWGMYLWTRPTASVIGVTTDGELEDWAITCGDLTHLLNLNGPGRNGFVVDEGWSVTLAIMWALYRAGVTDGSRVEASDTLLTESLNWSLNGGARASHRLGASEYAQAVATWQALIAYLAAARENPNNVVSSDPPEPQRVTTRDLEEKGIKWLDVLDVLHGLIGYAEPHRDMDGRYVAEPYPNVAVEGPTIYYRTDRGHLILPPLAVEPDIGGIANVVYVTGTSDANVNPGVVQAVADLDVLLPNHPLAARNSGVTIEDVITAAQPISQAAADAQARTALFDSIAGFESVKFDTPLNPQHEAFEMPALQVDRHADFADPQIMIEKSFKANLVTGRMSHTCARAFRPLGAEPQSTTVLTPVTVVPSDIANLLAWYDASDVATLTGDPVSQWNDKSGHAYHVSDHGVATARPARNIRPNGLTALDFDGSSDGLYYQGGAAVTPNNGPLTILAVHYADSRAPVVVPGVLSLRDSANGLPLIMASMSANVATDSVGLYRDVGGAGLREMGPTSATGLHLSAVTWDGTTGAAGLNGYLDGVAGASATAAGLLSANMNLILIGTDYLPYSAWFDGVICEVIVYARVLTSTELTNLSAYARTKWGTP